VITEYHAVGTKLASRGPLPRRMAAGRVCGEAGCSTRLTAYDRGDTCFRHSPTRFPRVRGHMESE